MEKDDAGVEQMEQEAAVTSPPLNRRDSSLAAISGGQGIFYEEYYDD